MKSISSNAMLTVNSTNVASFSEGGSLGNQPNQHRGNFAFREIQNKGNFSAVDFIGQICLSAVWSDALKLSAFRQLDRQRNLHLTRGLCQFARVFKGQNQIVAVRPRGYLARGELAGHSRRRCAFNHLQPLAVFRLPAHRTDCQAFVFRRLEFELSAVGLSRVIAVPPQAAGDMGAGSLGRPFAEPVPQTARRLFGVAVVAAAASEKGIAIRFAGGLHEDIAIIVTQGGKLCIIGGIITAGACVVFVPADAKAGRCFRVVMHQVVVQRGKL